MSDWVEIVQSHVNNLQTSHKEPDEAALWRKAVQSRVAGLSARKRRKAVGAIRKSRPNCDLLVENMEAEECKRFVIRIARKLYYQAGEESELRKLICNKLKNARARSRTRTEET